MTIDEQSKHLSSENTLRYGGASSDPRLGIVEDSGLSESSASASSSDTTRDASLLFGKVISAFTPVIQTTATGEHLLTLKVKAANNIRSLLFSGLYDDIKNSSLVEQVNESLDSYHIMLGASNRWSCTHPLIINFIEKYWPTKGFTRDPKQLVFDLVTLIKNITDIPHENTEIDFSSMFSEGEANRTSHPFSTTADSTISPVPRDATSTATRTDNHSDSISHASGDVSHKSFKKTNIDNELDDAAIKGCILDLERPRAVDRMPGDLFGFPIDGKTNKLTSEAKENLKKTGFDEPFNLEKDLAKGHKWLSKIQDTIDQLPEGREFMGLYIIFHSTTGELQDAIQHFLSYRQVKSKTPAERVSMLMRKITEALYKQGSEKEAYDAYFAVEYKGGCLKKHMRHILELRRQCSSNPIEQCHHMEIFSTFLRSIRAHPNAQLAIEKVITKKPLEQFGNPTDLAVKIDQAFKDITRFAPAVTFNSMDAIPQSFMAADRKRARVEDNEVDKTAEHRPSHRQQQYQPQQQSGGNFPNRRVRREYHTRTTPVCKRCGQEGHYASHCDEKFPDLDRRCSTCGDYNHKWCEKRSPHPCDRCNAQDHVASGCRGDRTNRNSFRQPNSQAHQRSTGASQGNN